MAEVADEVDEADAVVARRLGFVIRPLQALVNAPHLLVLLIVGIWVACSLVYALLEDKGPI